MQKNSPIWKIDVDELKLLVSQSKSYGEVLSKLGLTGIRCERRTLKLRLEKDNISAFHLMHSVPDSFNPKKRTNESIFVEHSTADRVTARRRILSENLKKYECEICNISIWNGNLLSLILDHKNGVNNDHRLENLRWLCPNCNSQTETYCGRNVAYRREEKYCDCGMKLTRKAKGEKCSRCFSFSLIKK